MDTFIVDCVMSHELGMEKYEDPPPFRSKNATLFMNAPLKKNPLKHLPDMSLILQENLKKSFNGFPHKFLHIFFQKSV